MASRMMSASQGGYGSGERCGELRRHPVLEPQHRLELGGGTGHDGGEAFAGGELLDAGGVEALEAHRQPRVAGGSVGPCSHAGHPAGHA